MARLARVVVPGYPHHIIQRGNRRQDVFFNDDDRIAYLDGLRLYAKPAGIHFWGYCLMDNHVHMIAVPDREDSFAIGFADAHKRYTRRINFREEWRGYLWQGRFKSYPLSEQHLYAAMRYIERNPVRAGIVARAWDYRWSSAQAHVFGQNDALLDKHYLRTEIRDWKTYLSEEDEAGNIKLLRAHANTGRPLGSDEFVKSIEDETGRILMKGKPGPKEELFC